MPTWETPLKLKYPFEGVRPYLLDELDLRRWLDGLLIDPPTLTIADFQPGEAYAGTAMVISGYHFSPTRANNHVMVGGQPALVVEASPNRLFVLTDATCQSGPVEVTVGGTTATAVREFAVRPWPAPDSDEPAPPYSFDGRGLPGSAPGGGPLPGGQPLPGGGPSAGDIPATGTAKVLVVVTYPTDLVPPNPTQVKADVTATFANVTTYYDQVSYGTLNVQVDVTDMVALLDDSAYYHRANGATGYPNVDEAVLPQLEAEAAQGAVDQGFDLDDYVVLTALVYLPGLSVRAWGGWSDQNFTYNDGAGTAINLTAAHPLSIIVARHDADWGRAAHEFGHSLIDGGAVLGEDIYSSDLVDPTQATGQEFDLMGDHDSHPLFSGFFMNQLGYYGAQNVLELQWDRNPFQQECLVSAHGDAKDGAPDRYNLIRVKVAHGLDYFIEVRQRPPTGSAQVYDANITMPPGSAKPGGVIVTKAISDVVHNNQQTRLITVLHDPEVLLSNDVATDPLRAFTVTVVDDQVSTNPLVCKVRVEWAQQIADTLGGDFDLWLTPWGPGYETVDVWIDRDPYGTYDFTDAAGNPTGNGDEPRPLEVNQFWAKVHNTGLAAANVRLTYYSVSPPGVGDNGTWTPLQTKVLPTVGASGEASDYVNWIPTVGQHTCLKVMAEPQFGEVSGGNNSAQENVFSFQPAAHSVPEPVSMLVAIRNPLDDEALVHISLGGVPQGYRAYLPHRWVRLPARGEMHMDLLVVPTEDLERLRSDIAEVAAKTQRFGVDPAPRIRVGGRVRRGYSEVLASGEVAASWFTSIGGLAARVEPKRLGSIRIEEDPLRHDDRQAVAVTGMVRPALRGQRLRVDLVGSDGSRRAAAVTTDDKGVFDAVFELDGSATSSGRLGLDPNFLRRGLTGDGNVSLGVSGVGRGGRVADLRRRRPVIYEVQAHIINAAELAPASSNVVSITRPSSP